MAKQIYFSIMNRVDDWKTFNILRYGCPLSKGLLNSQFKLSFFFFKRQTDFHYTRKLGINCFVPIKIQLNMWIVCFCLCALWGYVNMLFKKMLNVPAILPGFPLWMAIILHWYMPAGWGCMEIQSINVTELDKNLSPALAFRLSGLLKLSPHKCILTLSG